jgi:hypothetical protein
MTSNIDLWPQINKTVKIDTPLSILRQQAILLGEKTSNIIEGEIKTVPPTEEEIVSRREWVGSQEEGWSQGLVSKQKERNPNFQHYFFLVAPALSNYRHKLLTIEELPEETYPVTIKYANGTIQCQSEEDFLNGLRSIFADATTTKIIDSLIAKSNS